MLAETVRRAVEELRVKERAREEITDRARRARILSKQAILLAHGGDLDQASLRLEEARRLILEAKAGLGEHGLTPMVEVHEAEEEHAEASAFYGLKKSGILPSPEDIGVSLEAYILGIGDLIGELRREAIDWLRVGEAERAERELELMERIYLDLLSMEEASLLLRGLRRKLDVARVLIEETRGEVTSELARRRLSSSIERLIERLNRLERG